MMEAETAVGPLLAALNDCAIDVRLGAARALTNIKDETVITPLIQTLIQLATKGDDVSIREEAAKLLNDVPGGRDALYAPIMDALRISDWTTVVMLIGEPLPFLPANPNLYFWRSLAYPGLGRLKEALADCEWFIKFARDPAETHYLHYASLLSQLNRHEEALAAARRAVELAPDQVDCQGDLAWYAYKAGQYEEGITASHRALELDSHQPTFAFNLGLMLLASGQPGEAVNAYQQGISLCAGLDVGTARAYLDGALGDLDELTTSRPELVSAIGPCKLLLVKPASEEESK